MKRQIMFLGIMAILATFAFPGCIEDGTIKGRVLDKNGQGVIGANVMTEPETSAVQTDSSGKYIIMDVPLGDYIVTASSSGANGTEYVAVQPSIIASMGCAVSATDIVLNIDDTGAIITGEWTLVATYNTPHVGMGTEGLTFDGSNLWSCDVYSDYIYKHNMDATLSVAKTYASPGTSPTGLAWDGTNIWSCDGTAHKIYKHNMDITLSVAATYEMPEDECKSITFFNGNLWSCDGVHAKIYKHNMDATLSIAATYNSPTSTPHGLAFDGTYLWCCSDSLDEIYKLSIGSTLTVEKTYTSADGVPTPLCYGLACSIISGNKYIWACEYRNNKIYKFIAP